MKESSENCCCLVQKLSTSAAVLHKHCRHKNFVPEELVAGAVVDTAAAGEIGVVVADLADKTNTDIVPKREQSDRNLAMVAFLLCSPANQWFF
jgi:hypothetical protein